jgi:hypothetical protein
VPTHFRELTSILDYYSILQRKEILTHAAIWLALEDIMLIEINQAQKTSTS